MFKVAAAGLSSALGFSLENVYKSEHKLRGDQDRAYGYETLSYDRHYSDSPTV